MDSSIKVTAINASIYDQKFNQIFYQEFDLIFSCLDSMKAREHLAVQATKHGKPLIDAGTMSYFGQTYSSIRFRTSCHNCNPTHSEQTPASCTIRSHPQLPAHCATYAKNFYDSFFGINQAEALSDNLKYSKYVTSDHLADQEIS
jgi:ubiquitin-like 1-activating enzyme E1 B